ncbi:hypothetical protein HDR62_04000 [bacterium]|nr:hypothetical protein [bacterium]
MLEVIALIVIFLCFIVSLVCVVYSTYPKNIKLAMFFAYFTAMAIFSWQAVKAYKDMLNEKEERTRYVEESTHTSLEKLCDSLQLEHVIEESYVTLTDSTIDIHLLLNKR